MDASLTDAQEQVRNRVFEIIAQALPVFGRDFTVDITVVDNNVRVRLHGITALGMSIVPHLRDTLNKELIYDKSTRTPVNRIYQKRLPSIQVGQDTHGDGRHMVEKSDG